MKRHYIQVGNRWVPAEQVYAERAARRTSPREIAIVGDIPPEQWCRSPVDGSFLTSRADVREHNRRNHVVDVGNDSAFRNPRNPTVHRKSAAPMIARLLRGERIG